MKDTGEEEILFEDHNVITGGLGRSIAQFMSIGNCEDPIEGPCPTINADYPIGLPNLTNYDGGGSTTAPRPSPPPVIARHTKSAKCGPHDEDTPYYDAKCEIWPYQISHMQVGTGASSVVESSSVTILGAPLLRDKYGGLEKSIMLESTDHMIYAEEDIPIERQTLAAIGNQGIVGSGLVSIIILDESTANGISLNEVGIFVNNPYIKYTTPLKGVIIPTRIVRSLGGPPISPTTTDFQIPYFDPGNLLAAYKQFPPIIKEEFFTLIVRWAIYFTEDCDA